MKFKKIISVAASAILIASVGISASTYAENGYEDTIDAVEEYDVNYDDEIMLLDSESDEYDITSDDYADGYEESVGESGESDTLIAFIVCLIIGIITAAIVVGSMKSKMKTVRKNTRATDYQKRDSFVLERKDDAFLYKKVEKVAIPRSNPPSNNK